MKTRTAVATIILCCYFKMRTKLFNYRSSHLIALVFRCLLDDYFEFNCVRIQYDISNLFKPGTVYKSRYTFNFAFLFVKLKYWLDNVLRPFHETYTVYYQPTCLVVWSLLKSGSNVTMNNLLFPFIYRNWICFYFFTAQAVVNQLNTSLYYSVIKFLQFTNIVTFYLYYHFAHIFLTLKIIVIAHTTI